MASITAPFVPLSLPSEDICTSCGTTTTTTPYPRSCHFNSHRRSRSQIFIRNASPYGYGGDHIVRKRTATFRCGNAFAFAMEVTESSEAEIPRWRGALGFKEKFLQQQQQQGELMSLPRPLRNNADDVSLQNPLLRLHRMGCGWLGVILEWDGVIVEDQNTFDRESWLALAQEEGRPGPPAFILRKAEGMKSEQAISELFCWSREVKETRRLANRREEILLELHGGMYQLKLGSHEFVLTLKKYKIPIALTSIRPRLIVEKSLESLGLKGDFSVIVTAEDVYRGKPDPEMYMYAAQLLNVIPERCIVIGNSNSSVEAAHDTFMKCIAVAGKHPIYELTAADIVITRLDKLSLVDLKNLADMDSPEFQPPEPEPEMEPEEETLPQTRVAMSDRW